MSYRKILPVLAACIVASGSALAAEITIPLPDNTEVETSEAVYVCGDSEIPVTYINAGSISLAVLEIEGETIVASNVISGSGARYAGAEYIWWSKGDEAQFYDLMQGDDETPTESCTVRG